MATQRCPGAEVEATRREPAVEAEVAMMKEPAVEAEVTLPRLLAEEAHHSPQMLRERFVFLLQQHCHPDPTRRTRRYSLPEPMCRQNSTQQLHS